MQHVNRSTGSTWKMPKPWKTMLSRITSSAERAQWKNAMIGAWVAQQISEEEHSKKKQK